MNQKSSSNIVLIIILILIVSIAGYFFLKTTPQTQQTSTPIQTSSTNKNYILSVCGIKLTVNTNQAVNTENGDLYGQIIVGDPLPKSTLEVFCHVKDKNSLNPIYEISKYLSIQSSGASQVNKNIYRVFDKNTLLSIQQLYSAKNRGYREDSETIGFENKDWIYTFSFLNPEQAKNQDNFIISVNP